jgi:hypothetical protein
MPIVKVDTSSKNDYYSGWYKPNTSWPKLCGPKWLPINSKYSFDLGKAKDQLSEIEKQFPFKPFPIKENRLRWSYQGVGLTARPESTDPIYDSLRLYTKNGEIEIYKTFASMDKKNSELPPPQDLYEKNFSVKTEVYSDYLASVLEKFKSPLCKVRLLNLKPKGVITPHVDFPYYKQIRIHAALTTNSNVWWECEGEKFQIPADGNWYWFDTGKCHAVWNDGLSDRIVLSANLSIYEDLNEKGKNLNRDFYDLIQSGDL